MKHMEGNFHRRALQTLNDTPDYKTPAAHPQAQHRPLVHRTARGLIKPPFKQKSVENLLLLSENT